MSILTRYANKTADVKGFSFNSTLNPHKDDAAYIAVPCNGNGNLIGYVEPMISLVGKQFKEQNIWDVIPDLEINDDWSFSLPDDFFAESDKVWDRLGLLQGLKEPDKSIVSYNYTMMAVYLLSNEELANTTYGGMPLDTTIFPIIRRSSYSERMSNPKLFWEFCGNWLREHADWIDSFNRPGIKNDAEAEACLVLSETIESIITQKDDEVDN